MKRSKVILFSLIIFILCAIVTSCNKSTMYELYTKDFRFSKVVSGVSENYVVFANIPEVEREMDFNIDYFDYKKLLKGDVNEVKLKYFITRDRQGNITKVDGRYAYLVIEGE